MGGRKGRGGFLLTLKGKDKESDIDDKGLSMSSDGFLLTHLP